MIVSLSTDIVLLLLLFTALLRHRLYEREAPSLGHFLWKQVMVLLSGYGAPLICSMSVRVSFGS